ncbi:MAG: hypothetical protein JO211_04150 [Acidobacteriaceae bacterium]|nr:hypothetical protein [Acidobacteriaceae bacterium]
MRCGALHQIRSRLGAEKLGVLKRAIAFLLVVSGTVMAVMGLAGSG